MVNDPLDSLDDAAILEAIGVLLEYARDRAPSAVIARAERDLVSLAAQVMSKQMPAGAA